MADLCYLSPPTSIKKLNTQHVTPTSSRSSTSWRSHTNCQHYTLWFSLPSRTKVLAVTVEQQVMVIGRQWRNALHKTTSSNQARRGALPHRSLTVPFVSHSLCEEKAHSCVRACVCVCKTVSSAGSQGYPIGVLRTVAERGLPVLRQQSFHLARELLKSSCTLRCLPHS